MVSLDRIAARSVATVMTRNNVTTSMEPVSTDVMTAIKEMIVHKVLILSFLHVHAQKLEYTDAPVLRGHL